LRNTLEQGTSGAIVVPPSLRVQGCATRRPPLDQPVAHVAAAKTADRVPVGRQPVSHAAEPDGVLRSGAYRTVIHLRVSRAFDRMYAEMDVLGKDVRGVTQVVV